MRSKKAGELFHNDEGYNCAQAVLKAFQDVFNIADESIQAFSKLGGGRAEEGICGALHAARNLVPDSEKGEVLDKKFQDITGALKCQEIRKLNLIDCKGCVQTAAKIVDTL